MNQKRWRRMISFPLETPYQIQIEEEMARSNRVATLVVGVIILLFQATMIVTALMKPGGPVSTLRRTAYWWLYITLFAVTALFLVIEQVFYRRKKNYGQVFHRLCFGYAVIIELWGCLITLLDQYGGNDLSVYSYVTMALTALVIMKPWQSVTLFGGSWLLFNLSLSYFRDGSANAFGALINTLFISVLAAFISISFYRSKVRGVYNKIVIERQYVKIQEINQKLNRLAMTDELTQLNNRRYLETMLHDSHETEPVAMAGMMVDIDFFKQYNDTYGHLEGDRCLKEIARLILHFMEEKDAYAIRYGGEEFFLCLPRSSDEKVYEEAEALRALIETHAIPREDTPLGCVTVSIGVGGVENSRPEDLESLIQYADCALYLAKEQGRNRVVLYRGTVEREAIPADGLH